MQHWYQQDLISIADLAKDRITEVLTQAQSLKQTPQPQALADKIIASCFFEASTRTRLSFETAAYRLGARVIGFADAKNTSLAQKGESFSDSIKVISSYADAIIIRHPRAGAARYAAEISDKPVLNAGDGANQHPSQMLLDLFTIQECQGKLDGLHIAMVGDLKYSRTVHSLAQACTCFGARFYFVTNDALSLPDSIAQYLRYHGAMFTFHERLEEILPKVDIVYMTRLQKERFDEAEYRSIRNQFFLHADQLRKAKNNLRILSPLPRLQELDPSVDASPHAYYFQQAANGVYVRQALLHLILKQRNG